MPPIPDIAEVVIDPDTIRPRPPSPTPLLTCSDYLLFPDRLKITTPEDGKSKIELFIQKADISPDLQKSALEDLDSSDTNTGFKSLNVLERQHAYLKLAAEAFHQSGISLQELEEFTTLPQRCLVLASYISLYPNNVSTNVSLLRNPMILYYRCLIRGYERSLLDTWMYSDGKLEHAVSILQDMIQDLAKSETTETSIIAQVGYELGMYYSKRLEFGNAKRYFTSSRPYLEQSLEISAQIHAPLTITRLDALISFVTFAEYSVTDGDGLQQPLPQTSIPAPLVYKLGVMGLYGRKYDDVASLMLKSISKKASYANNFQHVLDVLKAIIDDAIRTDNNSQAIFLGIVMVFMCAEHGLEFVMKQLPASFLDTVGGRTSPDELTVIFHTFQTLYNLHSQQNTPSYSPKILETSKRVLRYIVLHANTKLLWGALQRFTIEHLGTENWLLPSDWEYPGCRYGIYLRNEKKKEPDARFNGFRMMRKRVKWMAGVRPDDFKKSDEMDEAIAIMSGSRIGPYSPFPLDLLSLVVYKADLHLLSTDFKTAHSLYQHVPQIHQRHNLVSSAVSSSTKELHEFLHKHYLAQNVYVERVHDFISPLASVTNGTLEATLTSPEVMQQFWSQLSNSYMNVLTQLRQGAENSPAIKRAIIGYYGKFILDMLLLYAKKDRWADIVAIVPVLLSNHVASFQIIANDPKLINQLNLSVKFTFVLAIVIEKFEKIGMPLSDTNPTDLSIFSRIQVDPNSMHDLHQSLMALLCLFDPALGQLQHLTGKDIREFVVEFLKSVGSERLTRFVMAGLAGGLSRGTSGYKIDLESFGVYALIFGKAESLQYLNNNALQAHLQQYPLAAITFTSQTPESIYATLTALATHQLSKQLIQHPPPASLHTSFLQLADLELAPTKSPSSFQNALLTLLESFAHLSNTFTNLEPLSTHFFHTRLFERFIETCLQSNSLSQIPILYQYRPLGGLARVLDEISEIILSHKTNFNSTDSFKKWIQNIWDKNILEVVVGKIVTKYRAKSQDSRSIASIQKLRGLDKMLLEDTEIWNPTELAVLERQCRFFEEWMGELAKY